jgi:hypothetical protein
VPESDDVDAELARCILWSLFAAASLTRQQPAVGELMPLPRRAVDDADWMLAAAVERFPFLAEPTA